MYLGSVLGTGWFGWAYFGPKLVVGGHLEKKNSISIFSKPMGSILFSHWAILGMEITNNGILMTSDYQGRSSGEAYVQFSSKESGEKALEKNKQSIGHRLVWLGMGPLA